MVDVTNTVHRIDVDGVELAYLEAGDGPLALLLHGFPDSARTWRHLVPELAAAGHRVVAPWLRGYAPSAAPADGNAELGALVQDAVSLHEALGGDDRAVLVGHDWGALITYGAATFAPDRWRRVVTLAIPPAAVMGGRLLSYRQVKMFWYQYVFQSPVAELIVGNNDLEFIEQLWAEWSPGYDAAADLGAAKSALRDPANLAAALSTYRATYDPASQVPAYAAQTGAAWSAPPQPTLYAHGIDDGCAYPPDPDEVGPHLAEGSEVLLVPDAGHFLHLEQPGVVNPAIVEFLAG